MSTMPPSERMRSIFTRRAANDDAVLCDRDLPPNWKPIPRTVYREPMVESGEGEFPIRVRPR